jgi:mRNA interferase MazF
MSNSQKYSPERGDVIYMNFSPQAGVEQSGRRPALVISSKHFNCFGGLVLVCPITSKIKGYKTEVLLPEILPVSGVILTHHLAARDLSVRGCEFICRVPDEILKEVQLRLVAFIQH